MNETWGQTSLSFFGVVGRRAGREMFLFRGARARALRGAAFLFRGARAQVLKGGGRGPTYPKIKSLCPEAVIHREEVRYGVLCQ